MLTRKLWYALNHPPATHPIFWRTLRRFNDTRSKITPYAGRLNWVDKLSLGYVIIFVLLLVLTNIVPRGTPQLPLLSGLLFLLTIPVIIPIIILLDRSALSGSFQGIRWALRVSQLIVKERQNNTYELLCLFPTGILTPLWAMCTGCIYSGQRFNRMVELHTSVLRFIVVFAFVLLTLAIPPNWSEALEMIFQFSLSIVVVLTALHFDFVQSLLTSLLISLIVPFYSANGLDARLWTIGGFLLAQVTAYVVALFGALFLLPALLVRLGITHWLGVFFQLGLATALLYLSREAIITLLWRWLLRLTDAPAASPGADFSLSA